MTNPSLMRVLSNGLMNRIDALDKTIRLVCARDLMREGIEYALRHHKIGLLSKLTCFINQIITPKELVLLPLDCHGAIVYRHFQDTPLFKRLENIKHGKLTLQDMLDADLARVIIGEIKSAIICGFAEDLLAYQMSGISAYPNIDRLPIAPLDMASRMNPQINDTTQIQQRVDERLDKLKSRFNPAIELLQKFFSDCLAKARSLKDVEACIKYIESYQNSGGGVSLVMVLNGVDIKALPSYKAYGSWLDIPIIRRVVLQIIENCSKDLKPSRVKSIKAFNEKKASEDLISGLDILYKLDIPQEYLPLCQKLLLKPFGRDTICFVEIFESNPSFFAKLIKAMPWASGLKDLLYSNFCLEDYNVIYHILMHEKFEALFTAIAKNCNIESLVVIANLKVISPIDGNEVAICDELGDREFCEVVLGRLQEVGALSSIANVVQYCFYTLDIDRELAIMCALQSGKIEQFLEISGDRCSIGEYIFSGRDIEGTKFMPMIYEAVELEAFAEFVYRYGSGSEDDSEMLQCLSWDDLDEVIIFGSDLEDYV